MNSDELLSDYMDGRLDAEGRRRVEALLAADAGLARRLRLMRAVRGALRETEAPAPAGLRASLRRAAAEAGERTSWLGLLKEALAPKPWAFGAASAFAAALVVLAVRHERPAPAATAAPVAASAWTAGEANREAAADLWADDEGGDDDAL
jgi:anti-sigma factor RsiW